MNDRETMHRATIAWFENEYGASLYYCTACGKQVADLGTGRTPRHKGNVSSYKDGLKIVGRNGIVKATIAGTSHRHSDW